ncbi:MAG: hypothetical protein M3Z16_03490, partial [Pseudomonadota bacterium]|nr:hypothetical protein [Pseudomonadota bacterium]
PGVAGPTTTNVAGSTLTAASTITGPGQLVINGIDIWQGSNVSADAKDLAAAITAAGISGLSASAAANVATGTWSNPSGTARSGTFVLNDGNGTYYYDFGLDQADDTASLAAFLNGNPAQAPGLVASDTGAGVTLTAADGSNITINFFSGAPADVGLGGIAYGVGVDGITYSHVDLSFTAMVGLSISGSQAAALGLPPMTPPPPGPPASFVSQIDLSTVAGANTALISLDTALATVAGQRAVLGAAQNRFAAAITVAQRSADDTGAARSRIVDADYAGEAASLVSSQIVQQAGTAMVAQANAMRGDVLRLLKS